jgi:hypothetical protein
MRGDSEVLVRADRNNSIFYNLLFRQLFSRIRENNPLIIIHRDFQELVRELRKIIKPRLIGVIALYSYFTTRRAATPGVIIQELEIADSTLYDLLEFMVQKELLVKVEKAVKGRGTPGRRSIIYALPGYTKQDILNAQKMEKMRTTKFLYPVIKARNLAIELMQRRGAKEITLKELISIIRENHLASRYGIYDIAEEVAWMLETMGYTVWR